MSARVSPSGNGTAVYQTPGQELDPSVQDNEVIRKICDFVRRGIFAEAQKLVSQISDRDRRWEIELHIQHSLHEHIAINDVSFM